ncbi:MAG TPA: alpha/beta hydrolase [Thermomicrobiales bacterium]|nr:alpha/beta hydrolase [Thermomicrobiales bacterium]
MPYAENAGVRLYYEVEGDGPPLVLHAGNMMRLQDWRREDVAVAQALRNDYRLILMDPRGYGRSDKPHDAAAYTFEARVRDVAAVLDAAEVEQARFWGYSLGALIGFGFGLRAPGRCHALILGGGAPASLDPARYARQASALRRGSMADHVAQMEMNAGPFPPAVREGLLANDPLVLAAHFEAACTYPDLTAELPTLRPPAFLYAGDADPYFAGVQQATEAIPGATFVALPGLNHGQAFQAAGAILPQVRAFLTQNG